MSKGSRDHGPPEGSASPGHQFGLVGQSPAIRELLRRIERVAPTEATVLILGERGTGKELVARALAATSPRRARAFIAVNCAALPTELLAGELFGHERGAFTGAMERRAGLLVAANGGTVFFDEIGDLAPAGQAMLLRFLQECEVRPLGATRALDLDVRVIAATNRDLEGAMAERTFRADLYDRLSEVVLRVPPLRERPGDVPPLFEHFLREASRRHGRPVPRVSAAELRAIEALPWPGNVRQLEKAASRAVLFADGRELRMADLDLRQAPPHPEPVDEGRGHPRTLRQREALRIAIERGAVSRRDLTVRFGVSGEAARRDLVALVREGLLRRSGRRRAATYQPVSAVDSAEQAGHR